MIRERALTLRYAYIVCLLVSPVHVTSIVRNPKTACTVIQLAPHGEQNTSVLKEKQILL